MQKQILPFVQDDKAAFAVDWFGGVKVCFVFGRAGFVVVGRMGFWRFTDGGVAGGSGCGCGE